MDKIEVIDGDHDYSLSDDFTDEEKRITQACFFRPKNNPGFVIAIAELNTPNQWDDAEFDLLCERLEMVWNA